MGAHWSFPLLSILHSAAWPLFFLTARLKVPLTCVYIHLYPSNEGERVSI
jgi:hypothetical protein